MTVKLGDRVKDIYTGLEGIAVGRTVWLYGCARIGIEPTELREGKVIEAHWFDEQRVVTVTTAPLRVSKQSAATTGGPQSDPVR